MQRAPLKRIAPEKFAVREFLEQTRSKRISRLSEVSSSVKAEPTSNHEKREASKNQIRIALDMFHNRFNKQAK